MRGLVGIRPRRPCARSHKAALARCQGGFSDPARAIERTAQEGGYDTIVIGNRGLSTVERVLHGSVSEHVATHAKTTVVIAR